MADIFISYAREDQEHAHALAKLLGNEGWSVWWDRTILPGKKFEQEIQKALDEAKCVIVLWSQASVKSDWVREEIADAAAKGVLVPAMIETVAIPLGFRRFQAADLSDWDGDVGHSDVQQMLTALNDVIRKGGSPRESEQARTTKTNIKTETSPLKGDRRWQAIILSKKSGSVLINFATDKQHILEWKSGPLFNSVILDGVSVSKSLGPYTERHVFAINDPNSSYPAELTVKGTLFYEVRFIVAGQILI